MVVLTEVTETQVFEELESEVRSYCRNWPVVFDSARGSWLQDTSGRAYLDFFTGAGALNYGHNHPALKAALLRYLSEDRVVHSLDMFTAAKREFLATFAELILAPRQLPYRVQFPGPAGTNAVEAALKLARKVTGRTEVVCFAGGFHGVSLGSLAVTANPVHRGAAGVPLRHTLRVPYDDGGGVDFGWLDDLAAGPAAEVPAAVIVEAVQGEGGLTAAQPAWLRALAERCRAHGILLIVDDVQMGCGRTGPFFSFEEAGIVPDIVCLSKSISGYGLPLALTLIREELDVWQPGEHNGTFRGFNPALVTATEALRRFWAGDELQRRTVALGERVEHALRELVAQIGADELSLRGRGLARGLAFAQPELAAAAAAEAFERGLLVERAGPSDEVLKLLPPLTIGADELAQGLGLLGEAVRAVC